MGQYRAALLAHIDSPDGNYEGTLALPQRTGDQVTELKDELCKLLTDNTDVSPARAESLVDVMMAFVRNT